MSDRLRSEIRRAGQGMQVPASDFAPVRRSGLRRRWARWTAIGLSPILLIGAIWTLAPAATDRGFKPADARLAHMEIAVVVRGLSGPSYVVLTTPDGSDWQRFENPEDATIYSAEWHPYEIRMIGHTSQPGADHPVIRTIDIEDSDDLRLSEPITTGMSPHWSPNADRIAFSRNLNGNDELFVRDLVTGNETRLTSKFAPDEWPSWSPDGQSLVYTSNVEGIINIFSMRPDGADVTQLTDGGYDTQATWSPDGTSIAFRRQPSNQSDWRGRLFLMDADGSNERPLLDELVRMSAIDWDPSGERIAYCRNDSDDHTSPWSLHVIDVRTGRSEKVLDLEGDCSSVSWRDPPADPGVGTSAPESSDWSSAGSGVFETGGFRFTNIEMRLAPQHDPTTDLARAVVRFDLKWADKEYPGTRECTWDVYDDDDDLIGSATSKFSATARRYKEPLIKDRIDVSGEPDRVVISCSDKRFDDPDGYFEFSDVNVEEREPDDTRGPGYEVGFLYRWRGDGDPVPQDCTVKLFDANGELVLVSDRGFVAMGAGPNGSYFMIDSQPDTDPATEATLDCVSIK